MIRKLWRDRRGGVATMSAGGALLAVLCAAVVVDGGSLALEARRVQGAADLAALAAVKDMAHGPAAAEATARDNAGDVRIRTELGLYAADAELKPIDRFRDPVAEEDPNAARVTVTGEAPVWFGRLILGRDTVSITRSATAATRLEPPTATFSIGSRLARLDGGVANQLLSALAGGQVSLTLMDYRALADADVSLLAFTDALATQVGVTAGDYDRLMASEIDAGQALAVLAGVSDGADAALNGLARAAQGKRLKVGDLIGVETDTPEAARDGLAASVSALDLAGATLEIAGGDRQVALDLGARTGLADLDVWLAIGERPNRSPWLTVTRDGQPIVRTAQARLYVEARTSQALAGLAQVRLPLLIELASSEARLEAIDCDPARAVDIGVRPGVARARVGTVDRSRLGDFKTALAIQRATVVNVAGLVTVKAAADVEAANAGFSTLRFDDVAITSQTAKTMKTTGLASGLVSSLLGRLSVDVDVIGLGIGLGDLAGALGRLLTPVGPALDGVVNGLLGALGLSFGEADVTVHGATCPDEPGVPVLVG